MRVAIRPLLRRWFVRAALVLLCLLGIDGIFLAVKWPFTEHQLVRSLEHFSSSEVRVGSFRRVYFSHPGYIAEDLTFLRPSKTGATKMASVKRLEARASWFAMLSDTHRLQRLVIRGLQVTIPAQVPPPMKLYPSLKDKTTITKLVANGAVLELASQEGQTLRFDFSRLTLENVKKQKAVKLRTSVHLSEPPGDLLVSGQFGPESQKDMGQTPLSGIFHLEHADLSTFHAIQGIVWSSGRFQGTLARCEVRGNAEAQDFEVTSAGNKMKVAGAFDAMVNGMNGDVTLRSAQIGMLHTELHVQGTVQGKDSKTVSIGFRSSHAQIGDFLRLFAKGDTPAAEGPMSLEGEAVLPPGREPFLRKVRLDGHFAITDLEFLHGNTQERVDKLSERARKKKDDTKSADPPDVPSSLQGEVHLSGGTAELSDMRFRTPGARAWGAGSYSLLTKQIDLRGKLATQASLSKAAGGGLKSLLLLPLDPFFKKKHAGAVLPVQITGVYPHPAFKVSLTGK